LRWTTGKVDLDLVEPGGMGGQVDQALRPRGINIGDWPLAPARY
jgi:hypothetical protein